MPILIENYNWGRSLENANPELTRQLSTAYINTATCVNTKASKYVTNGNTQPDVDPPADSQFNANWDIGDLYVRTDTNTAWIMTSRTSTKLATWTQIT